MMISSNFVLLLLLLSLYNTLSHLTRLQLLVCKFYSLQYLHVETRRLFNKKFWEEYIKPTFIKNFHSVW